jgi:hypothetical protein
MKTTARKASRRALDVIFRARLRHSSKPGGWTYVVWPRSAAFFGTRGLVKVEGLIDGVPFRSSFMALGDGRHMLPVRKAIRSRLDKQSGDSVTIELRARLN